MRSPLPEKSKSRSPMYDYGVKVNSDQPDNKGKFKYRWYCQASDECREAGVFVALAEGATSNAIDHLREKHSLQGKRSATMAANKNEHIKKVSTY